MGAREAALRALLSIEEGAAYSAAAAGRQTRHMGGGAVAGRQLPDGIDDEAEGAEGLDAVDVERLAAEGTEAMGAGGSKARTPEVAAKDAALTRELVYGVTKHRRALDYVIDARSHLPAARVSLNVRTILRIGVYQLLFLSRIPDRAACDESVKLAKKYSNEGAARFVNALLRRVARDRDAFAVGADAGARTFAGQPQGGSSADTEISLCGPLSPDCAKVAPADADMPPSQIRKTGLPEATDTAVALDVRWLKQGVQQRNRQGAKRGNQQVEKRGKRQGEPQGKQQGGQQGKQQGGRQGVQSGLQNSALDPVTALAIRYSFPDWLATRWASRYGLAGAERLMGACNARPRMSLRANARRATAAEVGALLAREGAGAAAGGAAAAAGATEAAPAAASVAPGRWLPEALTLTQTRLGSHSASATDDDTHGASAGGGATAATSASGTATAATSASGTAVTRTRAFQGGFCTIQDEAAMLCAAALRPRPGDRVLDLCAAPGGKAGHIAELTQGKATVFACDVRPHRAALIEQSMRRLGHADCVRVFVADAASPDFLNQFDSVLKTDAASSIPMVGTGPTSGDGSVSDAGPTSGDGSVSDADSTSARGSVSDTGSAIAACGMDLVLLDAPCTGFGALRRKPEIKWNRAPQDIGTLAVLQAALLETAARALKPGGALVYSVCTTEPEEGEELIAAFLASHAEFAGDTALSEPGFCTAAPFPGLLPSGYEARLFPHEHGVDGFYIARLRKKPSQQPQSLQQPYPQSQATGGVSP